MLSAASVIAAALLWLGVLFGIAVYGERRPRVFEGRWPTVYALSLAVYCTSWTFFGTVTQAARYDWPVPPTFVGTITLYALGAGVLVALVRQVREAGATSLADYIATRLGKDSWLAATVTLVAIGGIVPYIALQLKAVAMSYGLLVRADASQAPAAQLPAWQDGGLYVALSMAAFAMLFGTRSASAAEHNRGLVLAMAFEALLKLAAMLALGVFVLSLPDAPAVLAPTAQAPPPTWSGFAPLVILGVLAMFTLPHQFHVGAVECRDERHVRRARWLFPLYMLLIALPLLPLAQAGKTWLGDGVPSDLYVLALPLAHGHEGLALFAFLGGLSAGTGMVIVSTLALSLMIGNHLLTPLLLHGPWATRGRDLRGAVLMQRRVVILAIVLLAWVYSRLVAGNDALADVGALSFSALATLAPAVGFALWRPQTPPRAVIAGIAAAALAWTWLLLVPVLVEARGGAAAWLTQGPWHLAWVAPDAFLGLTGWSRLGRAVGVSLLCALVVTWLWAAWTQGAPRRATSRGLDAETLREVGLRFLPRERVELALHDAPRTGAASESQLERELASVLGSASARLLLDAARREAGRDFETVAAIVGEASQDLRFNQRVLEGALQNMSQGISVVDADLRLVAWNRRYAELFGFPDALLQVGTPVAELSRWALRQHGAGDVEAALQRRLSHMRAGTPHLSERRFSPNAPGNAPVGAALAASASAQGADATARHPNPASFTESKAPAVQPDTIIEIRGNPLPGGGFVATFTDVTAFRRTQDDLRRSNETLEQRVDERTALLQAARDEAERANDAKTRFLTAVGHDLLQPLHAAQLFTDALQQQVQAEPAGTLAQARLAEDKLSQIRGALDSTTDLLTGLLDMSRLDAGGLVPAPRAFPLSEVLEPLASEFAAMAADSGLRFRHVRSRAWTHSDPQLLRRILQNFLANAVRYTSHSHAQAAAEAPAGAPVGAASAASPFSFRTNTPTTPHTATPRIQTGSWEATPNAAPASGRVLLGIRRAHGALRIEVHDTGPGIPPEQQAVIFEEFRRGERAPGQGLGLGLSIADRIARLLDAPIALRSTPGRGTTFSVQVPRVATPAASAAAAPSHNFAGLRVLVVDNVPTVLQALRQMLEGWGCVVVACADGVQAETALLEAPADLWLLDYHLDRGDTGVALYQRLAGQLDPRPTLVLSADHTEQVRRAVLEAGLPLLPKPVKALALKSVMDRLLVARGGS
jgi:signal transduction histidine kinase/Na+/proline symporter/CheY-like chemotaxis protein